ncbi:MAG: PhaM family polyhydroxyalkanoate granule multifunctional regulatory protein [Burkholderiales bacterium]
MTNTSPFGPFAPGFEFLQGWVNQASAALPGIGQWVTPTLDPQELEKRINELRTVQFWLEQNVRMIAGTIQALEVQKMTLSTLKTMNVHMEDLRGSLQIKPQASDNPTATVAQPAATKSGPDPAKPANNNPASADPMQWWNSLTQQFTQLATEAMQKSAEDVSKHMSTGLHATTASTQSPSSGPAPGSEGDGSKATEKPSRKTAPKAAPKAPR